MQSAAPYRRHGRTVCDSPNTLFHTAACTGGACLFLACVARGCCGRLACRETSQLNNSVRWLPQRYADAACKHCIPAMTARAAAPRGQIPSCESRKGECGHRAEVPRLRVLEGPNHTPTRCSEK